MVRFDSGLSVGGWFTGLTVTVKLVVVILLLEPPLLTVTVMVDEPKEYATGVMLNVPFVLGLAYVTVGLGMTPVLLEDAVTVIA
jgi:hypothetical protein